MFFNECKIAKSLIVAVENRILGDDGQYGSNSNVRECMVRRATARGNLDGR